MIAICAWCKCSLGEKEPLELRLETHGICTECFADMAERVQNDATPYVEPETFSWTHSPTNQIQTTEEAINYGRVTS